MELFSEQNNTINNKKIVDRCPDAKVISMWKFIAQGKG
jgi:hypothetical protein